jgi:hypothetical protein
VADDSVEGAVEDRLRQGARTGTPYRGARSLTAVLPNGRTIWLRVDPSLAPVRAVGHLGQHVDNTARWRRAALKAQRDAIARLARTVDADARRLLDARFARARELRRQIVIRSRTLDRKLAKAREQHRSRIERQLQIDRETVGRLRRRDLWDKLTVISSLPLFVAYAQRDRPFGENNLALLVSLLVWLVGDEIVNAVFGSEKPSPYPLRDTDIWSYIAPAGNLLTGWWLLDGRQHEPFVSGRATIPIDQFEADPDPASTVTPPALPDLVYRYEATIKLKDLIAPDSFEDFKTFSDVPVVATIRSFRLSAAGTTANARILSIQAVVEEGALIVLVTAGAADTRTVDTDPIPSVLTDLEVAWIVGTQPSPIPTSG